MVFADAEISDCAEYGQTVVYTKQFWKSPTCDSTEYELNHSERNNITGVEVENSINVTKIAFRPHLCSIMHSFKITDDKGN